MDAGLGPICGIPIVASFCAVATLPFKEYERCECMQMSPAWAWPDAASSRTDSQGPAQRGDRFALRDAGLKRSDVQLAQMGSASAAIFSGEELIRGEVALRGLARYAPRSICSQGDDSCA